MSRSARWAVILILLFIVLALGVALLAVSLFSGGGGGSWSGEPVLALQLDGAIPELKSADPWFQFTAPDQIDMRDLIDGLQRASSDSQIEGLFVEIGSPALGWAQNEELRAALRRFAASGKWVECYLETAGEFSGANGAYMLATACPRVTMAPPGDIGLVALSIETPFVRGMLDKLGIEPQFGQRKEFKNAANTYTDTDYTAAHLEATKRLAESLTEEMVETISTGRKLAAEEVRRLIARGPHTGPEALRLKLVDDLAYRDQLRAAIVEKTGTDKPFIRLADYLRGGRPFERGSKRIAVIYALGGVVRGPSQEDLFGGTTMGSDTVVDELRRAREDDDIEAVVLRVDSPGGSYVASDLIRREVELVKAEKPIIVSMGNYAASGGYFVSMQASKIFTDSATLTGSIGVFSGKMVTKKFWADKVGINWSSIPSDASADFYSTQQPYGEHGRERMDAMLDRIYQDFVTKAASGRQMPFEQLEPLAHGRVWTGRDAVSRKLVDEIGGLYEATRYAVSAAGGDPDDGYRVVLMRREHGFFDRFRTSTLAMQLGLTPEMVRTLRTLQAVTDPQPVVTLRDPSLPEIR
jgi:protease-4